KFATSCGGREDSQSSPDKLYKIVLTSRSRVQITLATPTWDGVLALRRSCLEPTGQASARSAESACNNDSGDSHHAKIDTVLDAGTYFVLVDGHAQGNEGAFALTYTLVR